MTGAADPKSAVSLLVNGKILANVQSDSKGLFNYAFSDNDIASIGQGTFQLQSVASDLAGNFTSSDSYAFKIDTIAPRILNVDATSSITTSDAQAGCTICMRSEGA